MPVQVGDLKEQTGVPGPHPILHCAVCGAESSANASDYFNRVEHYVFRCCGTNMDLVMKKIVYQKVKP